MEVRPPKSKKEWDAYYLLRYEVLRKPWGQILGSERDDLEAEAFHISVFNQNEIIGVGRLDWKDEESRQIRFMAVHPNAQKMGVGKRMMEALEKEAWRSGAQYIILHARENAIGFYSGMGYELMEPSHLLFNEIQHFLMQKKKG